MYISDLIIIAAKKFGDYDEDGADDNAKYTRLKIADWVDAYNAAQKQLVATRPDAHYKHAVWQLSANESRHALPADCVQLISVDRNMGSDGATPGNAIEPADKSVLDRLLLSWHSDTGETAVEFAAYDIRQPKTLFTYPRTHVSTAVWVEGAYSYHFTEAVLGSITTTAVAAGAEFHNALIAWMLKEAFEIDVDSAAGFTQAQKQEQSFYNMLGVEFSSSKQIAPK